MHDVDFANDPNAFEKSEKRRRQGETLEFIINHPEFLTKEDDAG